MQDAFDALVPLDTYEKVQNSNYLGRTITMETLFEGRDNYGLDSVWSLPGNEPIPIRRIFRVACIIDRQDFHWFENREPYRSVLPLAENNIVTYEGVVVELLGWSTERFVDLVNRWDFVLEPCRIVSVNGEPVLQPIDS